MVVHRPARDARRSDNVLGPDRDVATRVEELPRRFDELSFRQSRPAQASAAAAIAVLSKPVLTRPSANARVEA